MKRKQVILAILLFVGISTYGQNDENGKFLESSKIDRQNIKRTSSIVEISNIDFQFDSIRALSEINRVNKSEAYPWISNDGLRLYFTYQTDSVDNIVISERKHVDSLFDAPRKLSINSSTMRNLSQWLSDDELDIYFIIFESDGLLNTSLYHSHRNSLEDDFGIPIRINLLGNITGFLSSPSITKDKEKLYIYNSDINSVQNILILKKATDNEYLLIDTLDVPNGYKPGPGKLGQNDLKYYLSLTDNYDNLKLYVYSRERTNDSFDSIYNLNNDKISNLTIRQHQPSISNNGIYFLFASSASNLWSNNDLFIAYNNISPSGIDYDLIKNSEISIYPNPTTENITFDFNKLIENELEIAIYTTNGIQVDSKIISKNCSKIVIPTTKYNSGVYIYKIMNSDSYIGNGKFIVRNY